MLHTFSCQAVASSLFFCCLYSFYEMLFKPHWLNLNKRAKDKKRDRQRDRDRDSGRDKQTETKIEQMGKGE